MASELAHPKRLAHYEERIIIRTNCALELGQNDAAPLFAAGKWPHNESIKFRKNKNTHVK